MLILNVGYDLDLPVMKLSREDKKPLAVYFVRVMVPLYNIVKAIVMKRPLTRGA